MPTVRVTSLQINGQAPGGPQLIASTYGRGVYSIPLPPVPQPQQLTAVEGEDTTLNPLGKVAAVIEGGSVQVNYGDGTPQVAGTLSLSGDVETVAGTHTFKFPGYYTVTMTIAPSGGGQPIVFNSYVTVTPDPIALASDYSLLDGFPGTVQLASFTDANTNYGPGDFQAIITWANGSASTGTITESGGVYSVTGYADSVNTGVPLSVTVLNTEAGTQATTSIACQLL